MAAGKGGAGMPRVKGSIVELAVADVNRLVDEGRLAPDELEVRLEARDHALLREKISGASWYDLGCYTRLLELLHEIEGEGREAYLVERGRRAAERLRHRGLYGYLDRDRRSFWGRRIGRFLVSLGHQVYEDTDWTFELVEDGVRGFAVHVRVPSDYPDAIRFTFQGFIECLSELYGSSTRVVSERPAPDRMVFHGTRR